MAPKTTTTRPTLTRDGMPTATLTYQEAAAYLGVSVSVVLRLTKAGQLPHVRVAHALRYRVVDLDRYLEDKVTREWNPGNLRGRWRRKA